MKKNIGSDFDSSQRRQAIVEIFAGSLAEYFGASDGRAENGKYEQKTSLFVEN